MSNDTASPESGIPRSMEEVDLKSLDFAESALQEQLLCPICCFVLSEPVSTSCGHTFCKECIKSALDAANSQDQQFKCPIDRHPLSSRSDLLPAAYLVTSLLNELEVYCPFKTRGCDFKGKRWTIENHISDDCKYVMVACGGDLDSSSCEQLVERRHVLDRGDGNECVHLVMSCPNECGDEFPRYKLGQHIANDCMKLTTECTDCLKQIPNPELKRHYDICPEAVISCSASQFGCSWSGKRIELDKHAMDCNFVQLLPLLTRQEKRMESLERENKTLRSHIERLTNRSSLFSGIDLSNESTTSSSGASQFNDSDLLHMFMECERLRRDVDRLGTTIGELEVKQGMMIMRENCRTGEEIANLRSGFNGLRHQIHFLLAERRMSTVRPQADTSSEVARQRLNDLIRDVKL